MCGQRKAFLGICLGLQLLFEGSEECVGVEGLGILPGKILRLPDDKGLKIPHMGWNSLQITPGAKLFAGIEEGAYVYFVHSYYLKAADETIVAASTEYAAHIHASVERGECLCLSVPPGEEQRCGDADPPELYPSGMSRGWIGNGMLDQDQDAGSGRGP